MPWMGNRLNLVTKCAGQDLLKIRQFRDVLTSEWGLEESSFFLEFKVVPVVLGHLSHIQENIKLFKSFSEILYPSPRAALSFIWSESFIRLRFLFFLFYRLWSRLGLQRFLFVSPLKSVQSAPHILYIILLLCCTTSSSKNPSRVATRHKPNTVRLKSPTSNRLAWAHNYGQRAVTTRQGP